MTELQKSYSLTELINLADAAWSSENRDDHWQILNEDLLKGIAWAKVDSSQGQARRDISRGMTRMNVLQIVSDLYEKEMWEVTSRYSSTHKIKRVVDFYYLTEREIENFAYSKNIPCGAKTLEHINNVLAAHQLPAINEVIK